MRSKQNPVKSFAIHLLFAPSLFALGLYLYQLDRTVGEAISVDQGGVLGLAAKLSLTGLSVVVRFLLAIGPYVLIFIGIALPICGALYAIERLDRRRAPIKPHRRKVVWLAACVESLGMLAMVLFVLGQMPA